PAPDAPAAQAHAASPRRGAARGQASGGFGGFGLEARGRETAARTNRLRRDPDVLHVFAHCETLKRSAAFTPKWQRVNEAAMGRRCETLTSSFSAPAQPA